MSALELALGIALSAVAVYFVLRPVLSPVPHAERPEAGDDGEDPEDDFSRRAVALRALKEIEFDRATGKLSDGDYDALQRKYTAEALVALREDEATPLPVVPRASPSGPTVACPTHGLRPERDARFCSACGRRLGEARGYCTRCGSALEPEARFCARCGVKVAA
ncbi:MAG: zinc ribbon domain-containing protein [Gemmatimonadales bacterium]